jgi:mannose-6-phosphate isomerase
MSQLPFSPITFHPQYHPRIWGGRSFESKLGRHLPDERPYGEAWELSDRADCQSAVVEGPLAGQSLHELWANHREEIFGDRFSQHPAARFPLLIKVLDCAEDLSVQVHPPAAVAPRLNGEPKTEVWYFADAQPGTRLYAGLRQGVTREVFERALRDGTVADCVHVLHPQPGDSLLVRSGRIHALGAGSLVFEIQQNSDTTYRVFDWNRLGLDGQPRALHVAESMQCIDFQDYEPCLHRGTESARLADCEHFSVVRRSPGQAPTMPGYRLIMALEPLTWAGTAVGAGRVAIWPQAAGTAPDPENGSWLEITIGADSERA